MQDFTKLQVWQKAHSLTLDVYRASLAFPKDEQYGLTSQLRRAAVSIPSNIAESCGRDTQTDFLRFLHIAMGSASEVQYQLLLSRDLTYLSDEHYRGLATSIEEVKKMLHNLIHSIKRTMRE